MIKDVVKDLIAADQIIDSVAMVKQKVEEEYAIRVKKPEIREVMKHQLGMRYKKITDVAVHANCERNLVCRQQFAVKLMELMAAGKTILNVDVCTQFHSSL